LLLQQSVSEQFMERLVQKTGALNIGPGQDDPDLGPLISKRQYDRVMGYIVVGKKEGAQLPIGGGHPSAPALEKGFYVEPTIFDSVSPAMRIFQEEIFGPVLSVTTFSDEEEAIDLANNSKYGLVAGVWTENMGKAHRVAKRIDAGQIYVNNWASGTGVATPFGGFKQSGLGREKGIETFHHYTQVKAISAFIGGEG
jgi:acyl-CoA reductase-like NAD-dependent aldehyde dehydrogenase